MSGAKCRNWAERRAPGRKLRWSLAGWTWGRQREYAARPTFRLVKQWVRTDRQTGMGSTTTAGPVLRVSLVEIREAMTFVIQRLTRLTTRVRPNIP